MPAQFGPSLNDLRRELEHQERMGHIGRRYYNTPDGPGTPSKDVPLPTAEPYGRRAGDVKTHPGYGRPLQGIEMPADGVMRETTLHGEDKMTESPLDTIKRHIAQIEDTLARLHSINDELAHQLAHEREQRMEAEALLAKRLDGLRRTASEWATHTPFNT